MSLPFSNCDARSKGLVVLHCHTAGLSCHERMAAALQLSGDDLGLGVCGDRRAGAGDHTGDGELPDDPRGNGESRKKPANGMMRRNAA